MQYSNPAAGVSLAGTLTLPDSEGPYPAAILIAGSGPNDRNEEIFGHKPFLVLADHLTKKGIAVLRVDKRGVGESTGDYDAATIEDFASDVLAGIAYLKTRAEIKQIGLIGHSEGGIIAPLVATRSTDVAFIALMAGTGVYGEEILYEQGALCMRASGGFTEERIAHQRDLQQRVFAVLKNEPDCIVAEPLLRDIFVRELAATSDERDCQLVDREVKTYNSKWFRTFLTREPSLVLKQVQIPVLVLNGELDLQVPPRQNLPVIEQALNEAGNKNYKIVEFPKLNHVFQTCTTGAIQDYQMIEETISPVVLDTMTEWILENL